MAKINSKPYNDRVSCTSPLRSKKVTRDKLDKILKWLGLEADGRVRDITKLINEYAGWDVFVKDGVSFSIEGVRWYKAYQDAVLMPSKYIKPDIQRFGRVWK